MAFPLEGSQGERVLLGVEEQRVPGESVLVLPSSFLPRALLLGGSGHSSVHVSAASSFLSSQSSLSEGREGSASPSDSGERLP